MNVTACPFGDDRKGFASRRAGPDELKKCHWLMPLLFFVCFSGCAYDIDRAYYSDANTFFSEANDLCYERNVRVLTKAGGQLLCTRCTISDSTTSFRASGATKDTSADNRDIEMIAVRNYFHGALRSCLAGALTGAGISAIIGFLNGPSARSTESSGYIYFVLPTFIIGGGFAGIAAVAFHGIEIRIFPDPNRQPKNPPPDKFIL